MKVDRKNLSRWQVDAAGACGCAVLTLAVYFLAFAPLRRGYASLAAKQEQLAAQGGKHARLERSVASTRGRLTETEQALADAELQLEPADRVNRRIAQVTGLATACGLKIDDVRLAKSRRRQHCIAFPITLAGTGTYRQCRGFLRRLKATFADTAVRAFDLSARPADPAAAKFRFDLLWHAAPPASGPEK